MDIEKFINELKAMGDEVIKENVIRVMNDRIYKDDYGFYVVFDLDVIITPETQVYFFSIDERKIHESLTNVTACNIFDPITKQVKTVELIKLIGDGYAVYNLYRIKRFQRLRFLLDTKVIPTEMRMMNFYYVGDKP